ncbi:MAG: hypothetical protein J7L21_02050 [Sulfurimonas sp.]|nr:hypothetical protein [Sulfurimonas sp.]
MRFNKQFKTVFLDLSSASFDLQETVNVILSPSLYWIKKVSLPVKYLRDAKPLLPSLFEDILPYGVYSYTLYKNGDDFFIFAYEDRVILETLSAKGISPAKVNDLYFAQSELDGVEGAIKIDETQSLYVKDGIVVLLPCCWIKESGNLDLETISLSNHRIKLKQFGYIADDKSLYTLATIFSIFILLVVVEFFITSQKVSSTLELKDELFNKYSLKPTMMQNRSMLKEYKNMHSTQIKARECIVSILSLKLKKGQRLSLFSLKGKKLTAEFSGVKKGGETSIENMFKNKKMKFKSTFKKNFWHVEIEF